MQGIEITEADFRSGAWLARLPELLAFTRSRRSEINGAAQAADFICGLVQTHEK
jgi:hypothetical protein